MMISIWMTSVWMIVKRDTLKQHILTKYLEVTHLKNAVIVMKGHFSYDN